MSNPAKRRSGLGWLGVVLAALLMGAMPIGAGAHDAHGEHKVIAKGDKCVRDTDEMRRNHMKMLKHQRDETMRKGIRTTQESLKNCIECHANPKTNSVASSKEDFCMGCHSYAAVKLDCFECHSTKPKAAGAVPRPIATPETKPEAGKDKQSGLKDRMPHEGAPTFYALSGVKDRMRWQLQAKLASLNMGEGVK